MMDAQRERLDWLWRRGSREAVLAAIEKLEDPAERGEFFVRAVEVMQRARPTMARFLSEVYVDAFYKDPEPFGPGVKPHGEILRVLARNYEQEGQLELAEWACGIAVDNGIAADGIEGGFAGWAERLRQKRATVG